MARLFIVEDDASLRENLVRMLKLKGHECLCCGSFANAAGEALAACPDCVLLDLSLPGAYGHEVCRSIRQESNAPIIVLTSSDSEFDEVMSMNVGADDYVVKPFNIRELLLRIRAILRRQVMVESNPVLSRHGVSVDPAAHRATVHGQDVELTATEFRLIEDLLRNAGRVRTREELLAAVWGYQFEGYARTVDTHIRRLRNKLGDAAEIIETVRGVGYRCKE